jgi:hypothetical protein
MVGKLGTSMCIFCLGIDSDFKVKGIRGIVSFIKYGMAVHTAYGTRTPTTSTGNNKDFLLIIYCR